jgi:hypothetical protein
MFVDGSPSCFNVSSQVISSAGEAGINVSSQVISSASEGGNSNSSSSSGDGGASAVCAGSFSS